MKKRILEYIKKETLISLEDEVDFSGVTTQIIAEKFQLKRNTASKLLNILVKDNKLIKVNTRPVIFLSKEELIINHYQIEKNEYKNLSQLKLCFEDDIFEQIIGAKGSLKTTIQQMKSAILYPGGGLPLILFGDSGTGKSFLVDVVFKYAKNQGVINKDASMYILNCAQYADNKELLSSILFGYKKGSFTGAEEDTPGLLEKANNGVVFLDEVHRLSPESQEKLFLFMDKGTFQRVGENNTIRKANVRLVFATTEKKEEFLLTTFMRRIPIQVELPSLDSRFNSERLALTYLFFKNEAKRLNGCFKISSKIIYFLANYTFKGNVGELKNIIQNICAYQYSCHPDKKEWMISFSNIPSEFSMLFDQDEKIVQNVIIEINQHTDIYNLNNLTIDEYPQIDQLFDQINETFQTEIDKASWIKQSIRRVNRILDSLTFVQYTERNKLVLSRMMKKCLDTIKYLEEENNLHFFVNSTTGIANYLYYRSGQALFNQEKLNTYDYEEVLQYLKRSYPSYHNYAKDLIFLLENKFDLFLNSCDEVVFTLYIISMDIKNQKEHQRALILAHGYATASSIANVANQLLATHVFDAFDMPIDVTPKQIANNLEEYLQKYNYQGEIIFLVDMGSVTEISNLLSSSFSNIVGILNNVTTSMAIQVGEKILKQESISKIFDEIPDYLEVDKKLYIPNNNKELAIITTCMTGIATAQKIKNLLLDSFPKNLNIHIEALDFYSLKNNQDQHVLFKQYKILAILGTDDPQISQYPFVSLESLLNGKDKKLGALLEHYLTESQIQDFNKKLIKNFSLDKVIESITILDSEKVLNEIDVALTSLEAILSLSLNNIVRLNLYIHISCLIERLIRNQPLTFFDKLVEFQKENQIFIKAVKKSFSGIEKKYSVKILDSEIGYLYNIIYNYY